MKIVINGSGYPEKRNIIVFPEYIYIDCKKKNLFSYVNVLRQKVLRKNKLFIFRPLPGAMPEQTGIIHLFNEVAETDTRWVSTFETEIPRVLPVDGIEKTENPELHKLLRLVASPECLRLIAISEATYNIQMKLLDSFPAFSEVIGKKLCILHPPQALLGEDGRETCGGRVSFTFIGNEFYRKGGAEVVLAFSELEEEGVISNEAVSVNMVGDLSRKHNIAHEPFQDSAHFHSQIERLLREKAFFTHSTSMPNDKIIGLLKETDVGILPTWQDTYGFSVLEMQACGCPVITTNVRALPEINPPSAGWLIECPLNDMYELAVDSEETKERVRRLVVDQLKSYVARIIRHPEDVRSRSARAIDRIREEHDPETFRDRLNEIYMPPEKH